MKKIAKVLATLLLLLFAVLFLGQSVQGASEELLDMEQQLDALGKDELIAQVPEDTRELLSQAGLDDLSVPQLLQLSPKDFFSTLWQLFLRELKRPFQTLGIIVAVTLLTVLLGGIGDIAPGGRMSQTFSLIAVLCILTSVITPILDCIVETSQAVKSASLFMLSFIPMFSAALVAAGHPATASSYNLFLFGTCQVVSQVVSQTLIPLMGIYLAICIVGAAIPDIKISTAAEGIKTVVSWALGFIVTLFVGLLSVQTMVTKSADTVTRKTAQFVLGSFVPVVGSALSDAMTVAQGCLRLIKTSVGAYGIAVAAFIFLPILIQTLLWCGVTGAASLVGELMGVEQVAEVMKSCCSVLGILIAIILSFGLLIIVSTSIVLLAGTAGV